MRWLICGLAAVLPVGANAADMGEFLRGSSTVISAPGGTRWDGFHVGGHVGWSVPGVDFTNNTGNIGSLAAMAGATTRTVTPLGNQDSSSTHFGGFAGYSTQWEGAVLGIEGTYNWLDKSLTAMNTVSGSFGSLASAVTYSGPGSATARIIDYGTVRLRAGWAAGSFFMPYAHFGLALGRMDINRTVVITPAATATTPPGLFIPGPITVTENLTNQFGYGWAAGLGTDFCLMANLFLRAEYEYVQFPDFQGLNAHIHSVRVGAALKF